jgi:hypothetical protein
MAITGYSHNFLKMAADRDCSGDFGKVGSEPDHLKKGAKFRMLNKLEG